MQQQQLAAGCREQEKAVGDPNGPKVILIYHPAVVPKKLELIGTK
jgi:hypothetical protein